MKTLNTKDLQKAQKLTSELSNLLGKLKGQNSKLNWDDLKEGNLRSKNDFTMQGMESTLESLLSDFQNMSESNK